MLSLKHVLVATDFTETSTRALAYAIELASRFEATITLLHTYEIPVFGFPDGALIASADVSARISTAAQEQLDAAVRAHDGRGVRITPLLRSGVAWEEINRVADEQSVDLVVIGTHGRRGIARALLGSVAENVIRLATRPVLTLHGPRDEG